jgi:hypothetical protein
MLFRWERNSAARHGAAGGEIQLLLAADANQTFYSSSPEDGDPVPTPPVMRTINAAGYW